MYFSYRRRKTGYSKYYVHGEFRKVKPPTFDRDVKFDQEHETWFIWIRKYFKLHD